MSVLNDPHIQAVAKTAPALVPGGVTLWADWLDAINTATSILFLLLSSIYLLWRWRVAWKKEKRELE